MTSARDASAALFGSNLVAMVTPMCPDGSVSTDGVTRLVHHLLATGCDGIVVAGTTGEAPTLTPAETSHLIGQVAHDARGRGRVIAGVGTYDTACSIEQARRAAAAGADALLLTCPYYSRPTQPGVIAHCVAVADATELPVMLYDVPHRTGIPLEPATLIELARHPRIRAVKDAKGDLFEAMTVLCATALAYYCGSDELNLPYLAIGASGVVSVTGNVDAAANAALIRAVRQGDLARAQAIHGAQLPLIDALMRTSQGAIMTKAALAHKGILAGAAVRLPLVESPAEHLEKLSRALVAVTRAA